MPNTAADASHPHFVRVGGINNDRANPATDIARPKPCPAAGTNPRRFDSVRSSRRSRLLLLRGFHHGYLLSRFLQTIGRNRSLLVLQLQPAESQRLIGTILPRSLFFEFVSFRRDHSGRGKKQCEGRTAQERAGDETRS